MFSVINCKSFIKKRINKGILLSFFEKKISEENKYKFFKNKY